MSSVDLNQDSLAILGFLEAPVALLIMSDRCILRCNTEAERLFGWPSAELQGQSIRLLYPSNADYEVIGQRWQHQLKSSHRYEDERFMQRRDGQVLWLRAKAITLTPDDPFRLMTWTFHQLRQQQTENVLLTPKEREVARLMINGCTSKEIGRLCGISPRTAEVHRSSILRKMGARNVAEMISKVVIGPTGQS